MIEPWVAQILAQIPLLAVFVWYIERREAREHERRRERDKEWREFINIEIKTRDKTTNDLHLRLVTEFTNLAKVVERSMK